MSKSTITVSIMIAAMLISLLATGQSMDKKQAQPMQESLTHDIQPGVIPVNDAQSDFDYTKLVTTNYTKDVIWDNGPILTNVGAAYNGADLSAVQTSLGMASSGGGFQIINEITIADDFEITEYTNVETIHFFAYQTGSGTTSTINKVYYQIWDGDPSAGGSVIYGDLATNRLISTDWTNMYRASDENPLNTDRPIMNVIADASGLNLIAGTYWVEVQADGSASSGPWCPPVTILGETTTGNALQNSGGWGIWDDSGTLTQQGMPFIINGTSGPQPTNDLSVTQIISPVSGSELGMETVTVLIENLGTDDQNNFDVSFSVTGSDVVIETVTAMIPSNGSLEYTFAASADLSVFGDYTVEVCSILADDEKPNNDCKTKIVSNMDIESITVYPLMEDYWTGSTDGITKTETSLAKALGDVEEGWMKFDISEIPAGVVITQIIFNGYVYDANYPFWSITPLASDPVTADAATLYAEIMDGTPEAIAYSYNDEDESFGEGWHEYVLTDAALIDLADAVEQGWFAVGCGGRDNNDTYFALFEGWNEVNVPYLEVFYNVAGQTAPTNLTADYLGEDIVLNWLTPGSISDDAKDFSGYNVYYSFDGGNFDMIAEEIIDTTYTHVDQAITGLHTYYVTAVYDEGESLPSNEVELLITSVENQMASSTILYPNPANDYVNISANIDILSITVYNHVGQIVTTKTVENNHYKIDIANFENGAYFLQLETEEGVISKRFIVE